MAIRRARGVAILVATILLGSLAVPQPADARRRRRARKKKAKPSPPGYAAAKKLFVEGVKLFNDGNYPKAIQKFRASLESYDNPKVYARIALCYKWIGNHLRALVNYERFLKAFPARPTRRRDRKLRAEVEQEVKNLLTKVARLKVSVPGPPGAEVRLNGRVVGRAPVSREIRLNPGTVNVLVTAAGYYVFRRDLKLVANQIATVGATLIKIKPKVKVIRQVVHVGAKPVYKRWWFWTAVGVLLAGGATGLAVGLTSRQQTRDLGGLPIQLNNLARW